MGSVNGPLISPFGTPAWGSESGPNRYWESGFGGVGRCAAAIGHDSSVPASPKPMAHAIVVFIRPSSSKISVRSPTEQRARLVNRAKSRPRRAPARKNIPDSVNILAAQSHYVQLS